MPNNAIHKIVNHPDCDEIISKLVLNIDYRDINKWLKDKYEPVGDATLIIGTATLRKFKDEYLDVYKTIKRDAIAMHSNSDLKVLDPTSLANSNNSYRQLLEEYADKELDIKSVLKSSMAVIQKRIEQIYNLIQTNPNNTKPDYILVQWIQNLTILLEKTENIINGSPDKIIQQNNINIQILDQHVHVFQKVIKEVIARLSYDDSLMFVSILNEEISKLKAPINEILPIDVRLEQAKKLEQFSSSQLDTPSL